MKVHIPVALTLPDARPRSGVSSTATWEQLKPHIGNAVRLNRDEVITDIVITMDGIQVYMERIADVE